MRLPPFILVHFFGNCWSYKSIDWLIMKKIFIQGWTVRYVIFSFSFFVLICLAVCVLRGHPLLGDGMYDYRVKTIMGRQVVTGPEFTQVNRSQVLPQATRDMWVVSTGDVHLNLYFLKEDLSTSSHSFSVGYPNFYFICYIETLKNLKWKFHKLCFC